MLLTVLVMRCPVTVGGGMRRRVAGSVALAGRWRSVAGNECRDSGDSDCYRQDSCVFLGSPYLDSCKPSRYGIAAVL